MPLRWWGGTLSHAHLRDYRLRSSAPMIATTNLAKEYGARVLFADVSLQLNAGSRYGLVGANGSGQTTFLKVLAGDEEASAGTRTIAKRPRAGALRQDRFLADEEHVRDHAI